MQAAAALGCVEVVPKHARVLHRLADHGLFKAGGVLVGTHAYLAYQNRLGVHWTGGDTTVDLNFAHPGKNISIALNANLKIDAHKAIDSLKMGFLPTNSGTRYYKSDEPDFDLDFLTCRTDESAAPIRIPQLNVSLQPLRFMEFSMEHPVIAVLPSGLGPIVVNIPAPERYALAKLLLYPERLHSQQPEKANKDLYQAASLIELLSSQQPMQLESAWEDLLSRGKTWRANATMAHQALQQRFPGMTYTLPGP